MELPFRLTSFSWSTEFVLCLAVIGDVEDECYGRVDNKHFVFRLALYILRHSVIFTRKITFYILLT
jgi:hypothetical protein